MNKREHQIGNQQNKRQASMPRYASTQAQLAIVLDVSRWTIIRSRQRDGNPGVGPDGRYDVKAWRAFLEQQREKRAGGANAAERLRNLRLKNDKLEAELEALHRDWAPMTDVIRWGKELGDAIRKIVSTLPLAAPSLVGLEVPELEKRLKAIEDDLLTRLHTISQNSK